MTSHRFEALTNTARWWLAGGLLVAAAMSLEMWTPSLCLLLGALGVLLFRHELTLDHKTQTYTEWRGIAGFTKPHVGTFGDLRAIRIDARDNNGRYQSYRSYPVTIEWERGPALAYTLCEETDFAKSAQLAADIAALTGIPVWESSQMALLRAALTDVPYLKTP